jgi:hypothetical protein
VPSRSHSSATTSISKNAVDAWTAAAHITDGRIFRAINKAGRAWGYGMSPRVLWDVVRTAAARAGIDKLAPHDLRRTCARLCHLAGGELDQIQFLLGHVSIQTTERDLGCKQKLRIAVNDRLGIEPRCRLTGTPGRMHQSALGDYSRLISARHRNPTHCPGSTDRLLQPGKKSMRLA